MNPSGKTIVGSLILPVALTIALVSCSPSGEGKASRKHVTELSQRITSNISGTGQPIEIEFIRGNAFNHPTFAIWLEDTEGKYIQTLFVTRAIGQSIFTYGDKADGTWKPGEVRRPAALPYWAHKRGIRASDGLYIPSADQPVPDAYSGATPKGNFSLTTRSDNPLPQQVKICMEINQTWDWNEYWTNSKYPDDKDYKTSCQPSVVYSAILNLANPDVVTLQPAGHGHYSGKDGSLTPDLSTLTTALNITSGITVRILPAK